MATVRVTAEVVRRDALLMACGRELKQAVLARLRNARLQLLVERVMGAVREARIVLRAVRTDSRDGLGVGRRRTGGR